MGGKKKKGGKGKKKAKENFTSNLPEPELHAAL